MIFDFRFSISDLVGFPGRRCSFAARNEKDSQLMCLASQRSDLFNPEKPASRDYVEPKRSLISFLFHDGCFVDEVSARFRSAKGPVIRSRRCSATDNLSSENVASSCLRQCLSEFQDAKREIPGSLFRFYFGHNLICNSKI